VAEHGSGEEHDATRSPAAADTPVSSEVRDHLRKVLEYHDFISAPQLSAFLTYVVEQTLQGAQDRIKAYSIATEALGRPPSFDPQQDPIVRVQARRLRQTLQAYYSAAGADAPMRIVLHAGSYVPRFESGAGLTARPSGEDQPASLAAEARPKPSWLRPAALILGLLVAVAGALLWLKLPWVRAELDPYSWEKPPTDANPLGMPAVVVSVASERQIPGWFSPELFAKGLEANLSKFDEFVVMAPVDNQPLADTDYRLDLVFSGQPGTVLGTVRLVRGRSGQIVWSNRFTVPEDAIDSYELLDSTRKLASTFGQPYGVLYAQVLSDPRRTRDQVCLLSGYEWFQDPKRDGVAPIVRCLNDIIERKPGNHVAYMMLAYMHVARFRLGLGEGPEDELASALTMARRAVALKPESAGTRQAMMEVQWAREKFDLALEEGRKAVQLNPNSSDVVADLGCRLIYEGKYSEGDTYVVRALRLNSQPPVWHSFCMFLAAYNTGDLAKARAVADTLEGQPAPEAAIPVILMAMEDGKKAKARDALDTLLAYEPGVAVDASEVLAKIGLFPNVAAPLSEDLNAALDEFDR
jgi:tetratricopeptide (TPR) repeat protein